MMWVGWWAAFGASAVATFAVVDNLYSRVLDVETGLREVSAKAARAELQALINELALKRALKRLGNGDDS